jgi:hypothetical protein
MAVLQADLNLGYRMPGKRCRIFIHNTGRLVMTSFLIVLMSTVSGIDLFTLLYVSCEAVSI